jgi:hypothetical protein
MLIEIIKTYDFYHSKQTQKISICIEADKIGSVISVTIKAVKRF